MTVSQVPATGGWSVVGGRGSGALGAWWTGMATCQALNVCWAYGFAAGVGGVYGCGSGSAYGFTAEGGAVYGCAAGAGAVTVRVGGVEEAGGANAGVVAAAVGGVTGWFDAAGGGGSSTRRSAEQCTHAG